MSNLVIAAARNNRYGHEPTKMKQKSSAFGLGGMAGIDTKFVLFFLALEYGRAGYALSLDGIVMGISMIMILVLPYFLPSRYEMPSFSNWLVYRGIVAVAGVAAGIVLGQTTGVLLPEGAGFIPMTLLIMASIVSCYIQFYGLMKLRQAN